MRSLIQEIERYSQLQRQLTYLIFFGISAYMAYIAITNYSIFINDAETDELNKLQAIANTVAAQIDGDVHRKLVLTYNEENDILTPQQDKAYYRIHNLLKGAVKYNQLETAIYTLFPNEYPYDPSIGELFFGVSSDSLLYYRHAYTSYPPELKKQFKIGGKVCNYKDDYGQWISAFAPIKDKRGETVAILMVDERFDSFISSARSNLARNFIAYIILLLFFGGILIYLSSRLIINMDSINLSLEEELTKRNNALQETNKLLNFKRQELDAFLHQASHYLLGPIASLKGLAKLIHEGSNTPEITHYGKLMIKSINQLHAFVNRQIEVSQLNNAEIFYSQCELLPIISEVVSDIHRKASQKGIKISLHSEGCELEADANLLQNIFRHLIENAITFHDTQKPNPYIRISTWQEKDTQFIEVADNGEGLREEVIPQLTEMFYRASQKSTGAGLGLYSVQKSLERLGGKLDIKSSLGEGSIFTVSLPLEPVHIIESTDDQHDPS